MEAAIIEAGKPETKGQDGWLKRAGKALMRGIGNTATYLGGMAAIGVTLAFGIAIVVPAVLGILTGASILGVLGAVASTLPTVGAYVGGALALAVGGAMLAELGGGSHFLKEERKSTASHVTGTAPDDAPNLALSTLVAMTASPSFNSASPRTSSFGVSPAVSAAISAATYGL